MEIYIKQKQTVENAIINLKRVLGGISSANSKEFKIKIGMDVQTFNDLTFVMNVMHRSTEEEKSLTASYSPSDLFKRLYGVEIVPYIPERF